MSKQQPIGAIDGDTVEQLSLDEIINQLKLCGFECEGGPLENNIAFISLERMVEEQKRGAHRARKIINSAVSLLSLLHHRGYIQYGDYGCPDKNEVSEMIAKLNGITIPGITEEIGYETD